MSKATSGGLSRAVVPHIAEPVIGRAFARPVGSCGLLALNTCSPNIEPIAKSVFALAGHLNVRPGTGAIAPARL
jgi:hypothetical protein